LTLRGEVLKVNARKGKKRKRRPHEESRQRQRRGKAETKAPEGVREEENQSVEP
jgi:hypothetical protein